MRSKNILFMVMALSIVSALTFSACGPSAATTDTPTGQLEPKQVYANSCAACHGANRLGTPDGPNILKGSLTAYTDASLAAFIGGHQGKIITASQAAAMATYLKTK